MRVYILLQFGCVLMFVMLIAGNALAAETPPGFAPGQRVLLDAHNCYPYNGLWADRVDRALAVGPPVGIENDLAWFTDPGTKKSWGIVAHGEPYTGKEPTLKNYFFEKVRPLVEKALKDGNTKDWPLITLNINDLRADDIGLFNEVWELMGEFESWLCTAAKTDDVNQISSIDVKPVLVLTSDGDKQAKVFYDQIPVGGKLRLFALGDPKKKADNFRRWLNYAWHAVEPKGQPKAGEWTPEAGARLTKIVDEGHAQGYWVRFYTLNGHSSAMVAAQGWSPSYNFGSLDAVKIRWKAAIDAGVDFIATDQFEEFVPLLRAGK